MVVGLWYFTVRTSYQFPMVTQQNKDCIFKPRLFACFLHELPDGPVRVFHNLNEVTNNEFDVKFLRPITVKADKMDNFKDGVDVGAEGSVIDVKLAFTDWRNYAFVTTPINYYTYYGVKSITIDTDKAQTTVNGKYEPIPAGMKVEYSGVEDISAGKFGKLTYINNKAEVGEFDIKLPVAVKYAWGTVEFDIVCHVAKTVK